MSENRLPIVTSDGHQIVAELEKAATSTDSVCILLHGIFTDRQEKGRFFRLSQRLRKAGLDVIRFDFRGHGESPLPFDHFDVAGGLIDYLTILEWTRRHGWNHTSIVGSSFGGSIVLLERMLRKRATLNSVVLLNPVIDYRTTFVSPKLEWGKGIFSEAVQREILTQGQALVEDQYRASASLLIQLSTIAPYSGIQYLDSPTLVFHGDEDDKVPVEPARSHFTGRKNVEYVEVSGAGHAFKDPVFENRVHAETTDWITERLERQ